MIQLVRRLWIRIFGDPPDPAWHAQTPVLKFRGYDGELARKAWRRSRRGMPRGLYRRPIAPPRDPTDG